MPKTDVRSRLAGIPVAVREIAPRISDVIGLKGKLKLTENAWSPGTGAVA